MFYFATFWLFCFIFVFVFLKYNPWIDIYDKDYVFLWYGIGDDRKYIKLFKKNTTND